jgi:hypothetical protein
MGGHDLMVQDLGSMDLVSWVWCHVGGYGVMDGIVHVMLRYVTVTYHESTPDVYTCAHCCALCTSCTPLYPLLPHIHPLRVHST